MPSDTPECERARSGVVLVGLMRPDARSLLTGPAAAANMAREALTDGKTRVKTRVATSATREINETHNRNVAADDAEQYERENEGNVCSNRNALWAKIAGVRNSPSALR